ncbi:Oidioi.mRNA.OKI2018_I69.chr1.g669.t1.cds [Oikopleura dioica]|uniref:Oidioi.mRNA.OKI2018_I69.chr1.g669.t1.cds n=1 Tax=Oikopleura dioica TaxID=34765 RepID=A0ABN7SPW4_OIKDI|nr:Oidioi.mRNA.OKI2018_I69.chr1.g669.t1.cds [Oikopleura dioica]
MRAVGLLPLLNAFTIEHGSSKGEFTIRGGDAAFDSIGGFLWADGRQFHLGDGSLEVYAEDTVSGRDEFGDYELLRWRAKAENEEEEILVEFFIRNYEKRDIIVFEQHFISGHDSQAVSEEDGMDTICTAFPMIRVPKLWFSKIDF